MAYPQLIIDALKYPLLAQNIKHAQQAGWPKILTYNGPDMKTLTRSNRQQAMRYELDDQLFEIPKIFSRDEYPFACTKEGGSVWVGHIPPRENCAQGGLLATFFKRHQVKSGQGEPFKFEVIVTNL